MGIHQLLYVRLTLGSFTIPKMEFTVKNRNKTLSSKIWYENKTAMFLPLKTTHTLPNDYILLYLITADSKGS